MIQVAPAAPSKTGMPYSGAPVLKFRGHSATIGVLAALVLTGCSAASAQEPLPTRIFVQATSTNPDVADRAFDEIAKGWKDSYTPLLIDQVRLLRPDRSGPSPGTRAKIARFLQRQTGKRFGEDFDEWREWMWSLPYDPHPDYAAFKGTLYSNVDRRIGAFFRSDKADIRLDEIDWGGVKVNGIPPLTYPRTVPVSEASYLKDSHVVFGLVIDGEARAYPKRILAWHEMAFDRVGGVELTVVYCTLCGTVIPYESVIGGEKRTFGTSGLLYRSNKLMFDAGTLSLWSTLEGRPVVGPLTGSGLELKARPIVTTTWGEWKSAHPETTVLSLETGFNRDYREGVAYRDYFSNDRLMFGVPLTDRRLKNKDEILGLLLPAQGGGRQPVAFSARFLARNRIHHAEFEGRSLLVITTRRGANRVFDAGQYRFAEQDGDDGVIDDQGRAWRVTEEALVLDEATPVRLPRVTAYRAFWFAWYAQFSDTELVK